MAALYGEPVPVGPLVPTSRKKPEWDVLGPQSTVIQAVALSCNIDPATLTENDIAGYLEPAFRADAELQQFYKRLCAAQEHANADTLPRVWRETKPSIMPFVVERVLFTEFSRWAQELDYPWELPMAFPGRWAVVTWSSWGKKDTAELWQAVALACNRSPDGATLEIATQYFGRKFNEMLGVAMNCAGDSLKILRPFAWSYPDDIREVAKQMEAGPPPQERATVRLAAFREWAEGKEYELPEQFPRPRKIEAPSAEPEPTTKPSLRKPETATSNERAMATRERTTLLVIIAALAKEAGIDPGETWKSAQRIEKLTMDMGARVSPEAISKKLREIPDALERAGKTSAGEE